MDDSELVQLNLCAKGQIENGFTLIKGFEEVDNMRQNMFRAGKDKNGINFKITMDNNAFAHETSVL